MRHENTKVLFCLAGIGGSRRWFAARGDVAGQSRSSNQSARGQIAGGRPGSRKSGSEQIFRSWSGSWFCRTCVRTRQCRFRPGISAQARARPTFSCLGSADVLRALAVCVGMTTVVNKSVEKDRRPIYSLAARRPFGRASSAAPSLSAAFAQFCHSVRV